MTARALPVSESCRAISVRSAHQKRFATANPPFLKKRPTDMPARLATAAVATLMRDALVPMPGAVAAVDTGSGPRSGTRESDIGWSSIGTAIEVDASTSDAGPPGRLADAPSADNTGSETAETGAVRRLPAPAMH